MTLFFVSDSKNQQDRLQGCSCQKRKLKREKKKELEPEVDCRKEKK